METTNEVLRKELSDITEKGEKDKEELQNQVKSMYEFAHKNLDPLLDVIDEISKTPQGAEALLKLQAKKQVKIEEEYDRLKTEE